MLLGFALGTLTGLVFKEKALWLKFLGTTFLTLLNMLVIPLVFSSLTVGVTAIKDFKKLGRVGAKTLLFYIGTTMIAIAIGLCFATLFQPGSGLHLTAQTAASTSSYETATLFQVFSDLIPKNPIQSLASGNILQVIVFSILLGLGIILAGEKGQGMITMLESLSNVMAAMTSLVMKLAPYGIFGSMAWVAGTFGLGVLLPLFKLVGIVYLTCLVHMVFVFGGILFLLARVKPWPFFKGMRDAIVIAASTTSSTATLPANLHCTQENLGVSKNIASFVLPLGATVNMNGTAIFQAIAALFIAQVYGIAMGWESLVMILITATLAAIGCAGIPGGGLVTLSIVLASVGLPLEGIVIFAGIDRIRDIICTVVNILGDAVVAVYVAKSEGELNEVQYSNKEIISFEPQVTKE